MVQAALAISHLLPQQSSEVLGLNPYIVQHGLWLRWGFSDVAKDQISHFLILHEFLESVCAPVMASPILIHGDDEDFLPCALREGFGFGSYCLDTICEEFSSLRFVIDPVMLGVLSF